MARKKGAKLSLGEMRLMGILWERGPLTLAEAFQSQPGQVGYTTIQTQLNRLVDKGVAARSKSRPMKYRPLASPTEAGAGLLQLLIDTVGGGKIIPLVAELVSRATLSKEDAQELKRIIDDATKKGPARTSPRGAIKRKAKRT
jgi:BlaI family penicillinase repressor